MWDDWINTQHGTICKSLWLVTPRAGCQRSSPLLSDWRRNKCWTRRKCRGSRRVCLECLCSDSKREREECRMKRNRKTCYRVKVSHRNVCSLLLLCASVRPSTFGRGLLLNCPLWHHNKMTSTPVFFFLRTLPERVDFLSPLMRQWLITNPVKESVTDLLVWSCGWSGVCSSGCSSSCSGGRTSSTRDRRVC